MPPLDKFSTYESPPLDYEICTYYYLDMPRKTADERKAYRNSIPLEKKREYYATYKAKHKEEILERSRKWHAANKERSNLNAKARYLRNPNPTRNSSYRKYGIDVDVYNRILTSQGGVCAVCKDSAPGYGRKHFAIDHDHITNKVRGLLCIHCNLMLGHAKDKKEILTAAILYLELTPSTDRSQPDLFAGTKDSESK